MSKRMIGKPFKKVNFSKVNSTLPYDIRDANIDLGVGLKPDTSLQAFAKGVGESDINAGDVILYSLGASALVGTAAIVADNILGHNSQPGAGHNSIVASYVNADSAVNNAQAFFVNNDINSTVVGTTPIESSDLAKVCNSYDVDVSRFKNDVKKGRKFAVVHSKDGDVLAVYNNRGTKILKTKELLKNESGTIVKNIVNYAANVFEKGLNLITPSACAKEIPSISSGQKKDVMNLMQSPNNEKTQFIFNVKTLGTFPNQKYDFSKLDVEDFYAENGISLLSLSKTALSYEEVCEENKNFWVHTNPLVGEASPEDKKFIDGLVNMAMDNYQLSELPKVVDQVKNVLNSSKYSDLEIKGVGFTDLVHSVYVAINKDVTFVNADNAESDDTHNMFTEPDQTIVVNDSELNRVLAYNLDDATKSYLHNDAVQSKLNQAAIKSVEKEIFKLEDLLVNDVDSLAIVHDKIGDMNVIVVEKDDIQYQVTADNEGNTLSFVVLNDTLSKFTHVISIGTPNEEDMKSFQAYSNLLKDLYKHASLAEKKNSVINSMGSENVNSKSIKEIVDLIDPSHGEVTEVVMNLNSSGNIPNQKFGFDNLSVQDYTPEHDVCNLLLEKDFLYYDQYFNKENQSLSLCADSLYIENTQDIIINKKIIDNLVDIAMDEYQLEQLPFVVEKVKNVLSSLDYSNLIVNDVTFIGKSFLNVSIDDNITFEIGYNSSTGIGRGSNSDDKWGAQNITITDPENNRKITYNLDEATKAYIHKDGMNDEFGSRAADAFGKEYSKLMDKLSDPSDSLFIVQDESPKGINSLIIEDRSAQYRIDADSEGNVFAFYLLDKSVSKYTFGIHLNSECRKKAEGLDEYFFEVYKFGTQRLYDDAVEVMNNRN